jgi:metal-responsive CopG/Arc/MetJ family transcriptional regulator
MESITIKVEDDFAREIDKAMRPYYSTKTEFIREALRDKVKKIEAERFMNKLEKFKGSAKVKVSDEELHKAREKIAKGYAKKFGIKLD